MSHTRGRQGRGAGFPRIFVAERDAKEGQATGRTTYSSGSGPYAAEATAPGRAARKRVGRVRRKVRKARTAMRSVAVAPTVRAMTTNTVGMTKSRSVKKIMVTAAMTMWNKR